MKKENRVPLQILLQALLCVGLVFVVYAGALFLLCYLLFRKRSRT